MRKLTRTEARHIAIAAQLLTAERPTDVVATAEQLTLLQLDPTAALAPSADVVLWSRLGTSYQPDQLREALEHDRALFEHRHQEDPSSGNINAIRPMSAIAWYRAEMEQLRTTPGTVRDWLDANTGFRQRVLDQLRADGPLTSKDIPDTAEVPWKSTGWTHGRNVTQLLELLASRGIVAVAGRSGKQRLWDLAECIYPSDAEQIPVAEARRLRDQARLRSHGVARPKYVGDAGEPIEIEGTSRTWRLDPDATTDGFEDRTALLSPFDRLIHARDRSLDLFDFEFMIELYNPNRSDAGATTPSPSSTTTNSSTRSTSPPITTPQHSRSTPYTTTKPSAPQCETDSAPNWNRSPTGSASTPSATHDRHARSRRFHKHHPPLRRRRTATGGPQRPPSSTTRHQGTDLTRHFQTYPPNRPAPIQEEHHGPEHSTHRSFATGR